MKENKNLYLKILIGISSLALAFHLIILLKVIPYEITWGGKLKNDREMYVFEIISITINAFFVYVLLQKGRFVNPILNNKTISIILWVFFIIFSLNTIGNLFAKTTFEKSFTVVTLASAILIWLTNRKTSTTYLILPGYGNSGESHWQTYFENNLPNCTRIQQKSWDKPNCKDWIETINDEVKQNNPESIVLISHSMGGIVIAHWALNYKTKIKGAMIVAPPDLENPYQDLGLESFTPIPTIKLPFPSVIVASTNDHWATTERTKLFAKNWGSKLIFIGDAGHINAATGYGNWEEGLTILKRTF